MKRWQHSEQLIVICEVLGMSVSTALVWIRWLAIQCEFGHTKTKLENWSGLLRFAIPFLPDALPARHDCYPWLMTVMTFHALESSVVQCIRLNWISAVIQRCRVCQLSASSELEDVIFLFFLAKSCGCSLDVPAKRSQRRSN